MVGHSGAQRRLRAALARTIHLVAVTAPSIGGRGGQFLALIALAAAVSPIEYGRFVVIQMLVVGVASVMGSSSAAAVNAATARVAGAVSIPVHVLLPALLRGRRRAFLIGAAASTLVVPIGYIVVSRTSPESSELIALAALGLLSGAMPLGDAVVAVASGSGRYLTGSTLDAGRAIVGAAAALIAAVHFGPIAGGFGLVVADVLLLAWMTVRAVAAGSTAPQVATTVPPREGMVAGVLANVIGQVTQWVVLLAVQLAGGPAALGVYGVASRFASVVTLAPIAFGKTVIGQLTDDSAFDRKWTPRSFIGMLTVLSSIAAGGAFAILIVGFPGLIDRYDGLVPVTAALLVGTIARALLIGVGHVCVARRLWRTWVIADLASLIVTLAGAMTAWLVGAGVLGAVVAFGLGSVAGLAVRAIGAFRRTRTTSGSLTR